MVLMYVRFLLSLRHVEDLLFERGIDICHETAELGWRDHPPDSLRAQKNGFARKDGSSRTHLTLALQAGSLTAAAVLFEYSLAETPAMVVGGAFEGVMTDVLEARVTGKASMSDFAEREQTFSAPASDNTNRHRIAVGHAIALQITYCTRGSFRA